MVSDWIGAGSDIFAAIGTVGAFLVGFMLLRREHHREADRAEDERRAQASRISAWVEAVQGTSGTRRVYFHIHNASEMPIYEVELPLAVPGGHEPEQADEFIGLIPPGQTVRRPAPPEWQRSYVEPEPVPIEFLDSAGRRWLRDEQGTLARVDR